MLYQSHNDEKHVRTRCRITELDLIYQRLIRDWEGGEGLVRTRKPNLRACLPEKNSYALCFLGNHHNLYIISIKRLLNTEFDKIISYFGYSSTKAKKAGKQ